MPLTIIFIISAIVLISVVIKNKKEKKIEQKQFTYISNFSVSEYFGRIEQENIQILMERESRPPYQIVLWAGLDGLRLNNDGTSEWIRKDMEKPKPKNDVFCSLPQLPYPTQYGIENTIPYLQSKIANLQMQNMLFLQNQYIINTIKPLSIQCNTIPSYYSNLTQCCCNRPY